MIQPLRLSLAIAGMLLAAHLSGQPAAPNNTLRGRVLYQSSGNKPAAGVRVAEPDANPAYSVDNGDYRLTFQSKRNGATLAVEIGPDTRDGKKIELVNEKELKSAKLPASAEEILEIIVCPAGQRDIAAQRYYRILRTTADRELEKVKKEFETVLAQQEKNYLKINELSEQITKMQAALDSAKIREQAFNIASINLDRASQMVKDAVRKIDEENDAEGALMILSAEALDTAGQIALEQLMKAKNNIQQVVEGYETRIGVLRQFYRFDSVALSYEKISELYVKAGYDEVEIANIIDEAATNWGLNGNYQKQLEFSQKALIIRESSLPLEHRDLPKSYNNMALAYSRLGDYEKQLEFILKAKDINENTLPAEHPDLSILYDNLGRAYGNLGDYEKQLEFTLKSLALLEKILPFNYSELAISYNNVAMAYREIGKYQQALEFNLKAVSTYEKIVAPDDPFLARSYGNLSAIYYNLGEYKKSMEFALKSLTILEKTLPPYHPQLAINYTNLASVFKELGDHRKQLDFNIKGLTIFEKVLPEDHPKLAWSYNNVALSYGNLGDYRKQLEFNLKGLAIYEKTLREDHPELAWAYSNLALNYGNLGDYQKQLEYYLKALNIYERTLPSEHTNLAILYAAMAATYSQLNEHQKALEFNLKALTILEKSLSSNHPNLAIAFSNTCRAYRDIGDYPKSIEYGLKAVRIGNLSDPVHPRLNTFYSNLGMTYVKAKRFQEAKVALEKSESLKAGVGVYKGWAMYYSLQKQKQQALESLQKAVALGFKDLKWLETEPDLKNIRKEKGYKDLVEQLKKQ